MLPKRPCPYCQKPCEGMNGLKYHVNKVHLRQACPVCGHISKNGFKGIKNHIFMRAKFTPESGHKILWGLIGCSHGHALAPLKRECRLLALAATAVG